MLAHFLGTKPDVACLFPRAANAAVFIAHGLAGLTGGADRFSRALASLDPPAAGTWVFVAALAELLTGLFVAIGLFTRWSALVQAILSGISLYVLASGSAAFKGGWEFDLAIFMTSLAILFLGPGRPSIERNVIGREI